MKLKLWRSLLLGLCLSNAIASQAQSQISPDGTTNTTVNSTDNTITIDSGDRAGDNLFHSFEQFNLPNGSEAFFDNSNDISNIFSRVTGGDISNINGLIRANGDASLFLINPAGIIFGEGAALDIGGSFFASTAEGIVFTDNVFSATDIEEPPLLTINQPLGLNFGNNPGDIAVNGSNLQVNNSETLALFGGNVTITGGQIIAPGANIELGGLTATGQISFSQSEDTFNSFSFPEEIARGDAILTNGTGVNVQASGGGNIRVNARNLELSGGELGESNLSAGIASELSSTEAQGGDITLNATNNITVSQGSLITNNLEEFGVGNSGDIKIATNSLSLTQGSQINSSIFGQGNGGKITINTLGTVSIDGEIETKTTLSGGIRTEIRLPSGTISVDGEIEAEIPSGIFSQVRQEAIGNSGEIDITTTNLKLTGGGRVDTSTLGLGNAGRIKIDAENISADGESQAGIIPSGIFSLVLNGARGNSGAIDITTSNLKLTRAVVSNSTLARGNAGAITIDAEGSVIADGASKNGIPSGILSIVLIGATGDSGDINITTTNLDLTKGAAVSAATAGVGDAGAVTIDASGNITAAGETQDGSYSSGIFNTVDTLGVGNSGDINITTANLSLTQGSEVNASTLGQGNAGTIAINVYENISLSGIDSAEFPGGILSLVAPNGIGNAGGIDINTNHLSLTNSAEISVQSLGQGEAGDLDIQTNSLALSDATSLLASTPVGTGGNINLQISDNLTLQDNSTISARALENANGGNINIDADFVIAQPDRGNDIVASADEGTGGNIDITTNAIFGLEERDSIPPNNTNDLDASSQLGVDGTIEINELDVNPTEALEELPVEVIDVASLVEQNLCQQGQGSEFVVTGKGGTAPSPARARERSVSEIDLVQPVFSDAEGAGEAWEAGEVARAEEIVEAQGWVINDRGMVELVARKTDIDSSPAQPEPQCHQ